MLPTCPVEEAQARRKELIDQLASGKEVIITEKQQPVAKLVGEHCALPPRLPAGQGKESILYMAADFDELMEEFRVLNR